MIHNILNVVAGHSLSAAGGAHRDLIDPTTGAVHGVATESRAADVDAAVASAREAFGSWRHTTPADRSAMLLRAADLLDAHTNELADLEVADTGKPRDVTRDEEIPASILEPTVVSGLRQDNELVQSEIFGPVITVQSYGGDDEALAMANGVEQGLTASVWTDSHSRAMRFLRDLDFDAVSVNAHAPTGSELPHGGFGSSGYGKDLGTYGLDDYTRIKHVAHAW